jgi:autotransporter-associated beta strand protein
MLSAANTYSGATHIVGGILKLGANNVLPAGTALTITDSQTVTFNMNSKSQTIGTLTGVNFASLTLNGALTIKETAPTTFAGVMSGAGGSLILDTSSTSALSLTGTNTFSGTTVINGGTLALSTNGSIGSSSSITVGNKGTFDVSGLTTALTLGTSQTLNAGGTGGFSSTINTAAGKGLTLGASTPLNFTAYDGTTVPLAISGAGSMTLAAGNPVTVTVSGSALAAGAYKLISKGASGSVAGTVPTSLTIAGAGTIAGATNSLSISNAELYLNVVGSLAPVTHMSIAPAGGGTLSINYSGGSGSHFVLLQATNVAAPLASWAKVQTNTASSGSFTITPGTNATGFYKIQSQ